MASSLAMGAIASPVLRDRNLSTGRTPSPNTTPWEPFGTIDAGAAEMSRRCGCWLLGKLWWGIIAPPAGGRAYAIRPYRTGVGSERVWVPRTIGHTVGSTQPHTPGL